MPKVTVKLGVKVAPAVPDAPDLEGVKPKKRGPKPKPASNDAIRVSVQSQEGDVTVLVDPPEVPRKYTPGHIQRIVLAIATACIVSGARLRHDVEIDLSGLKYDSLKVAVGRVIKASEKPRRGNY